MLMSSRRCINVIFVYVLMFFRRLCTSRHVLLDTLFDLASGILETSFFFFIVLIIEMIMS